MKEKEESKYDDLSPEQKEKAIKIDSYRESIKKRIYEFLLEIKSIKSNEKFEKKIIEFKSKLEERSLELPILKNLNLNPSNLHEYIDKVDILIFPISFMNSYYFNENQKSIVSVIFKEYLAFVGDYEMNALKVEYELEDSKKLKNSDNIDSRGYEEKDIILDENDQPFDLESEFKDTLRDIFTVEKESEDGILNDVYYKPLEHPDVPERIYDPIPLDYFLNEDGFWDDYILRRRAKIDVKLFSYKPFIPFGNNLKK